jgi:hypothetical protein
MKTLNCERCGVRVFFENVACENCGATLGFVPGELKMGSFEVSADGLWNRLAEGAAQQRPCANYVPQQVCNWMVPAESTDALCTCCRTTQIVPALHKPENLQHWATIEQSKRRLVYSLLSLGLPVVDRAVDPVHGLAFHFLEELVPTHRVLTGHDSGVITLNIAEADDARREQVRAKMREPYRTLLGHFRHEIGHYYWDLLIDNTPWIDEYRQLFGDERADYGQALKQHYASPRTDWQESFVSAYASAHPWEDWAECWAHYMHLQDGLETAAAWGLQLNHAMPGSPPIQASPLLCQQEKGVVEAALIERWLPVAQFVNAMSRSLGIHDGYPFIVSAPVIEKLEFIHQVVCAATCDQAMTPGAQEESVEPLPTVAPVPADQKVTAANA